MCNHLFCCDWISRCGRKISFSSLRRSREFCFLNNCLGLWQCHRFFQGDLSDKNTCTSVSYPRHGLCYVMRGSSMCSWYHLYLVMRVIARICLHGRCLNFFQSKHKHVRGNTYRENCLYRWDISSIISSPVPWSVLFLNTYFGDICQTLQHHKALKLEVCYLLNLTLWESEDLHFHELTLSKFTADNTLWMLQPTW